MSKSIPSALRSALYALCCLLSTLNIARADTLSDIQKEGVLRIGMGVMGTKPYIWQNADGSYAGFEYDMMQYAIKKLGIKNFEYVISEWTTMIPGLKAKRWDVIWSSMLITEERRQGGGIEFSNPYYEAVNKIAVLKGSNINTLNDLKGKIIGTQLGTAQEPLARSLIAQGLGQDLKLFDAIDQPFIALANKQIDAVVMDAPTIAGKEEVLPAITIIEGAALRYTPAPEWADAQAKAKYRFGGVGIGVRREDTTLLAALNDALAQMNADGTRKQILEKYNLWGDEQKPENM
jgi:ABC-type amino acid transport substrate-binding protein